MNINMIQIADKNVPRPPRELAWVSDARRMLTQATTVDEVKDIRDKAEALRLYMKQAGEGLGAQNAAAEVKLWAERRAGELLEEREPSRGGRPAKNQLHAATSFPSYSDLGIEKTQAHRWQLVARLPEEVFEEHIERTKRAERELTSAGMRKLAKQIEAQQAVAEPERPSAGDVVGSIAELVASGRKFATVYADPPWRYGNQGTRAATDNHYSTMTVDEICAEPVADVVEPNAHLHLWTTNAFLFEARRVMKAWGFTYKSVFLWVKPQMGIGNYWRVSHEFLLFGIRGKLPFRARDEMSWGQFKRGEHSAKPDAIRHKVEKVSPGPYLEMYGRVSTPGSPWTVYGNQISTEARLNGCL